MRTGSLLAPTVAVTGITFLRDVADQFLNTADFAAINQKVFIMNDIPEDIPVDTDEELLVSVFSDLLREVIAHTERGCIRITAKTFNNIVLVHIKNDGLLDYDAMFNNLEDIHAMAEKLGGFIGFTSFRNKVTTIAFSFRNMRD